MAAQHTAPLKILFIGNSFTARNNLPGLIAQLAAARSKGIEHRLISAGGASLRRHWNSGEALKAIQEGDYEYVVLQEQSTLPIKNPQRMHESIRLFHPAIQAAGAQTVLYLTWARLSAPESQQAITEAYTRIGGELGATVIPVGVVWQKFLRKHDPPALHDRDQSHPTLAGSYLAACVFFATLFKESPVGTGAAIAGLTQDDQLLLEKSAWAECTLAHQMGEGRVRGVTFRPPLSVFSFALLLLRRQIAARPGGRLAALEASWIDAFRKTSGEI